MATRLGRTSITESAYVVGRTSAPLDTTLTDKVTLSDRGCTKSMKGMTTVTDRDRLLAFLDGAGFEYTIKAAEDRRPFFTVDRRNVRDIASEVGAQ